MNETNSPLRSLGDSGASLSILYPASARGMELAEDAPEFFTDLNLHQIVDSITAGREEYNLKPFFYTPVHDLDTVNYRYEVLRDLDNQDLLANIRSFAREMQVMRALLAQADKAYYKPSKRSWFLDAAQVYCTAVMRLRDDLVTAELDSSGFLAFREYLLSYTASADFASLVAETEKLKADLSSITYSLYIEGKRITVSRYDSAPDYSADVIETFEKFKQDAPREYRFDFPDGPDMDHVEAAILDRVALLYPDIFTSLDEYYARHRAYVDSTLAAFDREVQFYVACIEHVDRFKTAGLPFCRPAVTSESKEVYGRDVFDLALAGRLVSERAAVVTNDFHLRDPERIIVVSGPNQGGKTTFARTFGQLHYLASLGCPVPGSEARLFLCDKLFTHFEREEDIRNLSGKLEDDLLRIHRILEQATPDSILIMNESFLSTTLSDALFLSKEVLERVIERDMLCVSVTFLDELASLAETTVSMVSTVDPRDPALRTFKIVRRPADGLAYAAAIAEKYGLTYGRVKTRIGAKTRRDGAS
jgi:DNA mismatch repair protein MutS